MHRTWDQQATYWSLVIAAVIIAAEATLHTTPNLMAEIPIFLKSELWAYVPLALVVIAAFLMTARTYGWIGKPMPPSSASISLANPPTTADVLPVSRDALLWNPQLQRDGDSILLKGIATRSGSNLIVQLQTFSIGHGPSIVPIVTDIMAGSPRMRLRGIESYHREEEISIVVATIEERKGEKPEHGSQFIAQWGSIDSGLPKSGVTNGHYFCRVFLVFEDGSEEFYPLMILGHGVHERIQAVGPGLFFKLSTLLSPP